MSGIPISGTTTTAATAGTATVAAGTPAGDVLPSAGTVVDAVQATVTSLPFTGIGLLGLLVAAFTLLACGLALSTLVRPAVTSAARAVSRSTPRG